MGVDLQLRLDSFFRGGEGMAGHSGDHRSVRSGLWGRPTWRFSGGLTCWNISTKKNPWWKPYLCLIKFTQWSWKSIDCIDVVICGFSICMFNEWRRVYWSVFHSREKKRTQNCQTCLLLASPIRWLADHFLFDSKCIRSYGGFLSHGGTPIYHPFIDHFSIINHQFWAFIDGFSMK